MASLSYVNRIQDYLEINLDIRTDADLIQWDVYFVPTFDLKARGYTSGRYQLRDMFSGMLLGLVGKLTPVWYPLSPATFLVKTATGPVRKRHLVQLVAPDNVSAMTMAGATYQGVAMNDAIDGEPVYVLLDGSFVAEVGAAPVPIGEPAVSDATGKIIAGIPGNFYAGIAVSGVVSIGGVDNQLITVSGVPAQVT